MICSRCVVPFLALYILLEEISAAALPNRYRNKRTVSWVDQELNPLWVDGPDQRDFSVGDTEEVGRVVDSRPSHPETFLTASTRRQHQSHHKANEKRRKVAPLDSISGFQMSSLRNRKDEPDIHWEEQNE